LRILGQPCEFYIADGFNWKLAVTIFLLLEASIQHVRGPAGIVLFVFVCHSSGSKNQALPPPNHESLSTVREVPSVRTEPNRPCQLLHPRVHKKAKDASVDSFGRLFLILVLVRANARAVVPLCLTPLFF
jgi:hypothetical protein